ncbi:hypothetical protein BGZ96_005505, partial [Linnemannia gamsii]
SPFMAQKLHRALLCSFKRRRGNSFWHSSKSCRTWRTYRSCKSSRTCASHRS